MILLKNVLLSGHPANIAVEAGRIARISEEPLHLPGAEEVDCSGKAVIPGFVNMHTHAAMILLRGIHEDLALYDWLSNIWKIEAGLDRDFIYWGSKVACLEMIRCGTTTFNDQYWYCPHTRRAALEMGLRPVLVEVAQQDGGDLVVQGALALESGPLDVVEGNGHVLVAEDHLVGMVGGKDLFLVSLED